MPNIKNEETLRTLTLAQLAALGAILEFPKSVISSESVAKNLRYGTGKSLSALASLANRKPRIVKKVGRLSARDGILWSYDDSFLPKETAKAIVKEIIDLIYESGVVDMPK